MNGKILASVNGQPITEAEVEAFIVGLGQRGEPYRSPEGRAAVLEELINRKLFLMEAARNLMEAEPAFKARLKEAKESLLAGYAMEKALAAVKVSDDEVAAYYQENKSALGGGEVLDASHILVATEEEAARVRGEIESGALSFEEAAAKYSSCPSKEAGGALGEFGRGQMVPEFEEACLAMEVGALSAPVRTQFGYHLIRLNGKKTQEPPTLDEVREPLRARLLSEKQQTAYRSKVNQLKILFPVDRA